MSSISLNNDERGYHFERGVVRCPADAILNGFGKMELNKRCSSGPKQYSSMLDFCTEVAADLPQRQAFYAVDLADVLLKVQEWEERLPNVEIFYAVKANTDAVLLQLLCKLGLSFDCASAEEIQMALDAGASPSDVIFAHTIKTEEELKYASDKGVRLITFDNEDELLKVHRVCPGAKLLVRLLPTSVSCSFDLSDKFGCSEEEAVRLLRLAKQLNLSVVGVSFHVGALCTDPESYTSTIRTSRDLFDTAREMGFQFSILDIGGGFFGESGKEHIFYKTADSINEALEQYFGDCKVRVIAEPGTYIVGSAFGLVSRVIGRRCFEKPGDDRPKRNYYINDGVYGSFFRQIELYGIEPIPLLAESEMKSRPVYTSRIYGQTCCSEDVILRSVSLSDLKIGELVYWKNMGAYSRGVSSTFCGVPLTIPRYVFVKNNKLSLEWLENKETVENFVKKHASVISSKSECLL